MDSAKRMGNLIDDLLSFSRIARTETRRTTVSLEATGQGSPGMKCSRRRAGREIGLEDRRMARSVWRPFDCSGLRWSISFPMFSLNASWVRVS